MTRYIADRTFHAYTADGDFVMIAKGVDIVDERHELYERFPENWVPAPPEPEVEQTTAAPGERRGGSR